MLQTMYASTLEIDDPSEAIEEILEQIDIDALLENSLGILACEREFILNGTVQALCDKLPFDVVGNTTNVSDICGEADEYQLSLMVLTSDTVSFAAGVSKPLGESTEDDLSALYNQLSDSLPGKASLGLFFAPFMLDVSADEQLKVLNETSQGVPLFGTVALDYVEQVRDPRTIYKGKDYTNCLVLALVSGEVNPEFLVESISEERFLQQKAIITASEGNLLKEVNAMPAIQYLESLGLAQNGTLENIPLVPLSVDVGDGGRPVARAIFAVTPDGSVVCGGEMPEGAALGVASFDAEDVQSTTKKLAHAIKDAENSKGALVFSCIGRNRALGLEPMHEIEQMQAILGKDMPYFFMYSGGEICPEYVDGKPLNKARNDSIVACVF